MRAAGRNRRGVLRRTPPGLGQGGFLAIAIVSFGGPLALVGLYVPGLVDDVSSSAGLVTLLAPLIFALPLVIWLRYARDISSSGGLFGFVEAAAGRRVALVQAAIWTVSYLLYILYTTVYIVYGILPLFFGGEIVRPSRTVRRGIVVAYIPSSQDQRLSQPAPSRLAVLRVVDDRFRR